MFINVIDDVTQQTYSCQPFDYDRVQSQYAVEGGTEQEDTPSPQKFVRTIEISHGAKNKVSDNYLIDLDIRIVPKAIPNRHVNIFANGRRISSLGGLKSFIKKSKKSWIWQHHHLIGYINANCLSPVITRDEFKHSRLRNKVYQALYALEGELEEHLEEFTSKKKDVTFERLESVINNALSFVVRKDKQDRRADNSPNKERNLLSDMVEDSMGSDDFEPEINTIDNTDTSVSTQLPQQQEEEDVEAVSRSDVENETVSEEPTSAKQANTINSGIARGVGLGVKFVKTLADNKRAQLAGHFIEINVSHSDFESRVGVKDGKQVLTERLLGYISNVVSAAYQSNVYSHNGNKYRGGSSATMSPSSSSPSDGEEVADSELLYDEMLDTIVNSSTRLEEKLREKLPLLQREIDSFNAEEEEVGEVAKADTHTTGTK